MKRLPGVLPIIALIASADSLAAAEQVTGRVTTVDEQTGTLVLENGETFTLGEGATMQDIEAGDEVTVSYEERDGDNVVMEIQPAEPQGQDKDRKSTRLNSSHSCAPRMPSSA